MTHRALQSDPQNRDPQSGLRYHPLRFASCVSAVGRATAAAERVSGLKTIRNLRCALKVSNQNMFDTEKLHFNWLLVTCAFIFLYTQALRPLHTHKKTF